MVEALLNHPIKETPGKRPKATMKVQKGKLYKCIQNVIMEDGEIAYIKGKVYPSQIDGHITNEEGFINHEWSDCCSQDLEECFEEYEYHEEDKWEERRYELAKAAMSGILANSRFDELSESGFFKGNVVGNALSYADEMIRQLRGDCHKIIIPPIEKGHNWVQPDPKSRYVKPYSREPTTVASSAEYRITPTD